MNVEMVRAEFARRLSSYGQVVIAGGAVRDCMMGKEPKDWDIFVLQGAGFDFEEAKADMAEALSDLSPIPPVVEWHRSEPFLVATVGWRDLEVQVLVNPAATVRELLDSFDWNVCLFAYDGTYQSLETVDNIAPGKSLRLHRVTYPLSTLRRGFRFSERFKMKLDRADVLTLCRQIIDKHDAGMDDTPDGNEPDAHAIGRNILVEGDDV